MAARTRQTAMNFKPMRQAEVPQGRNGKHKAIISRILSDLDQIAEGIALKVPLAQLTASKEQVRSALNLALTRKAGRFVATATDDDFLYMSGMRNADRTIFRMFSTRKEVRSPNTPELTCYAPLPAAGLTECSSIRLRGTDANTERS